MSRLKEILEGLKFATQDLPVSPDCLLDNAVKIMISENIDKSQKESRGISIQKPKIIESSVPTKSNNTITDKQKNLLVKIGKYKEGMTKQEAFQIIKELNNKREYQEY